MFRDCRFPRAAAVAAAGLAILALVACTEYEGVLPKHVRPLDQETRKLADRKGMEQTAPILIRLFKEESVLEVWKLEKESGRFLFLKDYEICTWSGVLGPKIKEGDRQAPEGFYTVRPAQMNPNSALYLSFDLGFPNAFDRAHGRTGSNLMVHGACSSRGCYSMTDENIQEIYTLGRLAFQGGQRDFQVQAFPFRMTPENLARYRNDPNMPFWLMLKDGSDHFELTGQPPKVDVCDRRYVFDAVAANGRAFNASAACPPMSLPDSLRMALQEKDARDRAEILALADRLDRREATAGAAAMRLAFASPNSAEHATALNMSVAVGAVSLEATSAAENPAPATAAMGAPATTALPAIPADAAANATPTAAPIAASPAGEPFLPVPELSTVTAGDQSVAPDAATLAERMLAGSEPSEASAADSGVSESEEEALRRMLLRLKKR